MTVVQDNALRQLLKKIDWKAYLDYGVVEIKIRNGEFKTTEIKRTYEEVK